MQPKPASKYHALKWLIELTKNNFQTKFGVEYNELEVQEMIILKKMRKATQAVKDQAKALKLAAREASLGFVEIVAPVFIFKNNRRNNFNQAFAA